MRRVIWLLVLLVACEPQQCGTMAGAFDVRVALSEIRSAEARDGLCSRVGKRDEVIERWTETTVTVVPDGHGGMTTSYKYEDHCRWYDWDLFDRQTVRVSYGDNVDWPTVTAPPVEETRKRLSRHRILEAFIMTEEGAVRCETDTRTLDQITHGSPVCIVSGNLVTPE